MKFRHILSGVACALLVTCTLPADETQKASQTTDKSKKTQEIGAGDSHLVDALAQWLANGNKAEIELGQLAQQKATNPEVKQFAQKMVKDHTEYLQKLQKFTDEKEHTVAGTDQKKSQDDIANRSATDQRKTDENRAQAQGDQKIEERVAGFRGDDKHKHGKHATMEQIGKEAGKLHLQMTKELLNKYQGHNFDMAYVGQQIAAHTQMLANLKAMEEHTTGEFGTVVKEGVQATESHLKEAKELSDSLQKRGGQPEPALQNRTIEREKAVPDVEVE